MPVPTRLRPEPLGDYVGTAAHRAFLETKGQSRASPDLPVHSCFFGLPMGDGNAVEFMQGGHRRLLKEEGVSDETEITNGKFLPRGPWYHAVVIDDLKSMAKVPRGLAVEAIPSGQSGDLILRERARRGYRKHGWREALHKAEQDESNIQVLGADVRGEAALS